MSLRSDDDPFVIAPFLHRRDYIKYPNVSYPNVREFLSEDYGNLSAEGIDRLFQSMFGSSLSPEDVEFSLSSLGKTASGIVRQVAPVAVQLAPVAAQLAPVGGAIAGTLIVGPGLGTAAGAAIGSAAGQALSNVSQPRARTVPARTAPAQPSVQAPSAQPQPVPRPVSTRPQPSPAAARLASLLANPQVQQSLVALLMGNAGAQSLRISGQSIPVGAIANTLEVLARDAALEHNALRSGDGAAASTYLLNDYGEFLVDPASQEARAALVYELVAADNASLFAAQEKISKLYEQLEDRERQDFFEDNELELLEDDDEEFEI